MAVAGCLAILLVCVFAACTDAKDKVTPPNIVVFVANNLGYGDLGCYGNSTIETPNIDQLARDGARFTRMYSQIGATSSKAALLTGQQPSRHGLISDHPSRTTFHSPTVDGGLMTRLTYDENIAIHLNRNGYRTSYLGPWDLGSGADGRFLPNNVGFNHFFGTLHSNFFACTSDAKYKRDHNYYFSLHMASRVLDNTVIAIFIGFVYFKKYASRRLICLMLTLWLIHIFVQWFMIWLTIANPKTCVLIRHDDIIQQPYKDGQLIVNLTEEAVSQISSESNGSLFLVLAYPGSPSEPSSQFKGSSKHGIYGDLLQEIDWSVGKVMSSLEEANMKNNTLVLFTSDNGPQAFEQFSDVPIDPDLRGSTGTAQDISGNKVTLRGHKGTLLEGGIRVPAIVSWPTHFRATEVHAVSSLMDFVPTILEIIGMKKGFYKTRYFDGNSWFSKLSVQAVQKDFDTTDAMVFHHCDMDNVAAVSYGDYKIHYTDNTGSYCDGTPIDAPLIYNIKEDPGEMTPLPVKSYQNILNDVTLALVKYENTYVRPAARQLELWPIPWLFPCVNVPFCTK